MKNASLDMSHYQTNPRGKSGVSRQGKHLTRASKQGLERQSLRINKKTGRSNKNTTSYDTLNAAVNKTFKKLGIGGANGINQSAIAFENPKPSLMIVSGNQQAFTGSQA